MYRSGQIKNKRLGMKRDKRRSEAKRWGETCRKGKRNTNSSAVLGIESEGEGGGVQSRVG